MTHGITEKSYWVDSLQNASAIKGVLGGEILELCGAHLSQVVVNDSGEVRLTIDLTQRPKCVPDRWTRTGYDKFQVRIALYDMTFSRALGGLIGGSEIAEFVLFAGKFEVRTVEGFELFIAFSHAQGDLVPRHKKSDFDPDWWFLQATKA